MAYKRGESCKKLKDKLELYLGRPATIEEQDPLFILDIFLDRLDNLQKRIELLEKKS